MVKVLKDVSLEPGGIRLIPTAPLAALSRLDIPSLLQVSGNFFTANRLVGFLIEGQPNPMYVCSQGGVTGVVPGQSQTDITAKVSG